MPYSMVSFKEIMISLRPLRNREMGLKDNRRIASPMPILSALTKTYKRNTTMSNEIQILLYKWTGTRAFVEIKSQWKTQPYDLRLSKMKKKWKNSHITNYMTCQFGAAKTSQISSAIQKISVTLSYVTIAITACKLLLFNTLKSKQFSLITKLSDAYILSNSR